MQKLQLQNYQKKEQPQNFDENIKIAREGGTIAGDTRKAIEKRTGDSVITSKNATELNQVIIDLIEGVVDESNN